MSGPTATAPSIDHRTLRRSSKGVTTASRSRCCTEGLGSRSARPPHFSTIEQATKERVEIALLHTRFRLPQRSTTTPPADRAREERPSRDPVTSGPGVCITDLSNHGRTTAPSADRAREERPRRDPVMSGPGVHHRPHPPPAAHRTPRRSSKRRRSASRSRHVRTGCASPTSVTTGGPPHPLLIEQGRNDRVEILLAHRKSRQQHRSTTTPRSSRAGGTIASRSCWRTEGLGYSIARPPHSSLIERGRNDRVEIPSDHR